MRSGDNLWLIARAALVTREPGTVDDASIARYWRRMIAANVATLQSRDPNLIYPGEVVALPPIT